MSPAGRWYRCKACGGVCALLDDGRIAHQKPGELVGRPGVQCTAYHYANTREQFFDLLAGEPIESPESMTPVGPEYEH